MQQITTTNVGKRYNREWIFRHFNYTFSIQNRYAITGNNGSGKSTLLQVIAGAIDKSEGEVRYQDTVPEKQYQQLAMAAPYLELVEEMTATEFLQFHQCFKPLTQPITDILARIGLQNAGTKQIRQFSSGMKQRLKLAQAIFSNTPVLLLDEPTTNLDAGGITLYHELVEQYTQQKLVIISSNDKQEYGFCTEVISMETYK